MIDKPAVKSSSDVSLLVAILVIAVPKMLATQCFGRNSAQSRQSHAIRHFFRVLVRASATLHELVAAHHRNKENILMSLGPAILRGFRHRLSSSISSSTHRSFSSVSMAKTLSSPFHSSSTGVSTTPFSQSNIFSSSPNLPQIRPSLNRYHFQ